MSKSGATWEDRAFMKALRQCAGLRKNIDLKKELRRRAKNVGMRLVKIYKDKGVALDTITQKVKSLGVRVRIRPKIRAKGKLHRWTYAKMIMAEARARKSAKGFASTGWFPSVEKLGGTPRRPQRPGGGPRRGKLIEKLGFGEMSETLVNQQPGAARTHDKNKQAEQQALDAETADLVKYIARKLDDTARRNGLT